MRFLKQFGVQPRYPKEIFLTDTDVEKAIKCALEVRDFNAITGLREINET